MPPKGRYAFRDAVFKNFKDREDFVFHPHPGHLVKKANNIFVNEKYAKELNRSKIFFTCGSRISTGSVAVLKYLDRKSTRLNSSHVAISYAVFCLKKKNK